MRGERTWGKLDEQNRGKIVPEGTFKALIVNVLDKTTKNGDPMVSVAFMVSEGYDFVWDNIVIPNAGSPAEKIKGRTQHFLHCIGEPYEGTFAWDSERWVNKSCTVKIKHEDPNNYHPNAIRPIVEEYVKEETSASEKSVSLDNIKPEFNNQQELPF